MYLNLNLANVKTKPIKTENMCENKSVQQKAITNCK